MNKVIVDNVKLRRRALARCISENVISGRTGCCDISGLHGDGTVSVRFKSTEYVSAYDFAKRFQEHLVGTNRSFEWDGEVRFSVMLSEFSPVTG